MTLAAASSTRTAVKPTRRSENAKPSVVVTFAAGTRLKRRTSSASRSSDVVDQVPRGLLITFGSVRPQAEVQHPAVIVAVALHAVLVKALDGSFLRASRPRAARRVDRSVSLTVPDDCSHCVFSPSTGTRL